MQGKNIPRARYWGQWTAVGLQDGDGEEVAARVAEEAAEVAADWHIFNVMDVQNESGTHPP